MPMIVLDQTTVDEYRGASVRDADSISGRYDRGESGEEFRPAERLSTRKKDETPGDFATEKRRSTGKGRYAAGLDGRAIVSTANVKAGCHYYV